MTKKNWLRILMVFVCLMLVCSFALAQDCTHPEEKRAFRYFDWEDTEYVNNNDGRTHVATYINPYNMNQCTDCGTMLREDLTMDPVTEPHSFALGECGCDAVEADTGCEHVSDTFDHASNTYDHEGSLGEREFVWLNGDQHQKSYTPLDVYVCNLCGCMYDRVGEHKTVTENHRQQSQNPSVCRYCGGTIGETVYEIVYVDNAWYCDDRFEDEVHYAAYGEPTPLYNNGVDPYHEGYWFAGWRPEIAETVTGNARYLAYFGLNGEDCAHFDFTCQSEYETRVPEGETWMPDGQGHHTANAWAGAVYVCTECGEELLDGSSFVQTQDCYDGDDEDALCDTCGGCMHVSTTPTGETIYLPVERWYSEGWGYHYGNAVQCEIYTCDACGGEVYVALGDVQWVSKEDCYDNNGDDICDACGWSICSHENWEPTEEYVQWLDEHAYWIGNGHHAVMARRGQEYYCPDCDMHLFDAYENFREYTYDCFDGDDEDTQCDECGADCWCSHNNISEWFWVYTSNSWSDNGDGTHTGMGYELYGYNCYDCQDYIGSRTHDEMREYTMAHRYDENGVCEEWNCGAAKPECEHPNATATGERIETNPWWEDRCDGTHTRWYHVYNTYYCEDCDTLYKVMENERYCTVEPHTMENGACVVCGAPDCAHVNKESQERTEFYEYPNTGWYATGWNQHKRYGVMYDEYYCHDCHQFVRVAIDEPQTYTFNCEDGDGDGHCDHCWWFFCDHTAESLEERDDRHYELAEGASWQWVSNGHHSANCDVGYWYYCYGCDQQFFDPQYQEVITEGCWSNDGDDRCDGCGGEMCRHENRQDNGDWYQPVDGENWVNAGWGHHGANCNVGVGFYCFDCEAHHVEIHYQDYIVEQCWEGDNKDNRCDGCYCEYSGSWGDCNHEGDQNYFTHYSLQGDSWTINDDGTHSGLALEVYGFDCSSCGNYIGRPTHDYVRWYTIPHSLNGGNNTCHDCGAAMNGCWHPESEFTGETLVKDQVCYDNWDGTHAVVTRLLNMHICKECGETFAVEGEGSVVIEGHTFEGDHCACGAANCEHTYDQPDEEGVIRFLWGYGWEFTGTSQHTGYGRRCDRYTCTKCDQFVYEARSDWGWITEDCVDNDGNGLCDHCNWAFCDHPEDQLMLRNDGHCEPKPGESWQWVSSGHHSADCRVGYWYHCNACDQGFFEPKYEDTVTQNCYDNNGNGVCDGCGAEMCRHENREINNDHHYQPVEGENWHHVGWGHHGATCDVGVGLYCYDCQDYYTEFYYEEYIVEQCWEGGNADNRCDGCGCEFGENWGSCDHGFEQEYFYHYSVDENGWTDNGDGTHSGLAVEVWGYNCPGCGEYFGRPTHDDERWYTVGHNLNWDEQKCWDCGADMNQCWHDEHIRTEETLIKDSHYMNNDDGTHMRFDRLLDLCICQMEGCGVEFYLDGNEVMSVEGHTFNEDGWCVCGAKNCDHSDLTKLRLEEEDMIRLLWGTGWESTHNNKHTGTGTKHDRYTCNECGQTVLIPVNGTGETEFFEINCYSNDGDNWCDDCGWYFACENHDPQVINDQHYNLCDGEDWHYAGNYQHVGLCDKGIWYHCYGCDQGWFADAYEFGVEFIGDCWDDENNPDGHCDGCGAEMCRHEGNTSDWHNGFDMTSGWVDNGLGQHSATGYELWGFDCYDCGQYVGYRTHDDERTFTFDHGYNSEDTVCGACGAVWTCDHEDATFNERGQQFNQVVEDMFDGNHIRWFEVYHEYTCDDCGAVFLRYVDAGEEIEAHIYANGECVVCGAPECDHTDLTQLTLVRENTIILNPGRGWRQTSRGAHAGYGVMGNIYYCEACDHRVYERYEGEELRYLTEDCFDGDDENNNCDICDWFFCDHPEESLTGKNENFHQCVEDEGWYYVGDGKHRAVCEIGTEYFCTACNQWVFFKEIDAQEYTYDCGDGNGDERCDACGEYVAPCPHNDRTDDFYHYAGTYTDNGNGTHTGWGHEMYGFWCRDCENYIAEVTHEEERQYTKEHDFNGDGVCDADGCGAVYSGCDHENATFNERGRSYNVTFEDALDGNHLRRFEVFHEFTCNDCGAVFMRYIEPGEELEPHTYSGGLCTGCGAPECDHTDLTQLTLVRENVIILNPGRGWNRANTGTHTGYGVYGDIYYCEACDHDVYDRKSTEAAYLTENCFDNDEDGHCDACWWTFCEHPEDKLEHLEDNFHHCVEDEGWYYVGNYKHSAVCEVGNWWFCHDCGEHVFEKLVDAKEYTYNCHDGNGDGRCDACGGEPCPHDNLQVENPNHCQPVNGQEWEYVGFGSHGAICHVGEWGYCPDCDDYVERIDRGHEEYRVQQCWEGDNLDNVCDGCGHEYGENWGNCNHDGNRSIDYNHYELKDGEEWVINDNGTHSGWAIEVWGFQCWDCGTHIAQPKHDDYRWYTVPHSLNEENNTCWDCGAAVDPCPHEHGEPTGETEFLYAEYHNNDDGTHTVVARLLDELRCEDCGEIFLRDHGNETVYSEAHIFENGACVHCAYPDCEHPDEYLRMTDMDWIRPVWGTGWESNGTGKHFCEGVMYDRYVCDLCGWAWLDPINGTGESEIFEGDCFDDDDDNHCDECGWYFCDHDNYYSENDEHYEPVRGAHWVSSGNGRHTAICDVGYWYTCEDCGQSWFADAYDFGVEFEGHCWDDENNPDGRCDGCGAEMCRHEGDRSRDYNQYHCDWEPYNENLHRGWGFEVRGFDCYECGEFVGERTHEEEREYFQEHHFNENEGVCWECGMEMTCGHWGNATYVEGADEWHNLVYENLFDGTHACYYDLFCTYTCRECGETFMRNEGRRCEIQEHEGNHEVVCPCGWAGCEHTYTEENLIDENIVRPQAGYRFFGEGMGYHWTEYGAKYNVYECTDCGDPIFVMLGEVEKNIRENCFDGDDDNRECDVCGWPVECQHPNREERDECHWWMENEEPEYIGCGMHEVLAHFGMMYYCPDCDRDFFDAYEDFRLYAFICEDHNGDGRCDQCRADMPCEHNSDGKEWHDGFVTGWWTDNGDGTHSAEGYWAWGFDCDCGEFIGHPKSDKKITFVIDHEYDENGECYCGAQRVCDHEELQGVGDEQYLNVIFENQYNSTHYVEYDVYREFYCEECDVSVMRFIERRDEILEHEFEDGVCGCGAAECDHAEKTPRALDEFRQMSDWKRDYRGHHEAWGAFYDRYNCDLCRETVLILKADEAIYSFDCYDDDKDGECDECGYDFCQHPNLEPMNDEHYEPIPGREWEFIGNNKHFADCRVAVLMWCPDCGHHTRDYISEEIVERIENCWDEDENGECDECGGEYNPCEHKNKELINAEHLEPVVGTNWVFAGDGRHEALCDKGPIYWCLDCEHHVFEPTEFGVEGNWPCGDEDDGDGKCDSCGADYEKCTHPADKLELDNPEHWEIAEGQEWVYAGNGHHKALCNIAPGYICERCDEYVVGAFERLNVMCYGLCWDEDGDGKCDDCGQEDVCDHENADWYDGYNEYVCDEWTDNGDGTHSGMGYEKNGVYCPDCEQFIAGNTHENLVEFTMPHEFGEDGKCKQCGAEQPDCEHKNVTETDDPREPINPWIGDRYDNQHIRWYDQLITYTCDDCGETIKRISEERKWVLEDHTFEDGECVCGAKECAHGNTTRLQENDFIHSAGDWWQADGYGKHDVSGAWYDIYTCNDCGTYVYELVRAEENVVEDCIDEDNDGHCDTCGWEFCDHPNKVVKDNYYKLTYDSKWKYVGDGRHGATCEVGTYWFCPDCEFEAFTKESDAQYYVFECDDGDNDGECDKCGAIAACSHVNREFVDETAEHVGYTDNGDNGRTHTITLTGVTEIYECSDCGEEIEVYVEVKTYNKSHVFWDGACKCGLSENAFCAHDERSEFMYERKDAVYVCVSRTHHKVTFIPLDTYDCLTCGCRIITQGEQMTVNEEHTVAGENETECIYCGEFGDIYTLTFQFVGEGAGEGYTRDVKAGADVTLPIGVGETFENDGTPVRLKSWTENTPEGAEPVQFTIAEPNEWGARMYSFTMPERDVTVTGEWEKVYAVVYCDGVDDKEIFEDEWHTCVYGEATPAFNNGVNPVREGYVFMGWNPEVAETVTDHAYYYAVWAECAHESYELTGNTEASTEETTSSEPIEGNDNKHKDYIQLYEEATCLVCGKLIMVPTEPGERESDHSYVGGQCEICGYSCSHSDVTDDVCGACGETVNTDRTTPSIQHINISPDTGVVGCEVTYRATVLDDTALARYELYINDVLAAEGELSGTEDTVEFMTTELGVGEYYFELAVYDAANNVWRHKFIMPVVIVEEEQENMPPVISDITSSAGTEIPIGMTVEFYASVSDDHDRLSKVELFIDNEVKESVETNESVYTIRHTTNELTEGEHVIRVVATDAEGLTAEKTLTVTVICTHQHKRPTGNSRDTLDDCVPIDEYQHMDHFTIYDEMSCPDCGAVFEDAIPGTAPQNHTYENGVCTACEYECGHAKWTDGVCDVCAMACEHSWTDGVCNVCAKEDKTAPTIVLSQVTPNAGNVGCTISYYAEVSDSTALGSYKLYINDELKAEGTLSGKAAPIRYSTSELSVGEYYFTLVVSDTAGNEESERFAIPVVITCEHVFGGGHVCGVCGYSKLEIIVQPTNAGAYVDETATVSVTAIGEDLTYEWYYSADGGSTWELTSKNTGRGPSYSLKMTEARDNRLVKCVITDIYGKSVETDVVMLDTYMKAAIETNPVDVWAFMDDEATFTVEATGDGVTYQWYYKLAGDGDYQMADCMENAFSVTMTEAWNGAKVYCVVTDVYGNTEETRVATLTMKGALAIIVQPTDAWAYEGETATVSLTAIGDELAYEWYYSTDGGSTWKLTDASSGRSASYSLKMTAARDNRLVKCKVTDAYDNYEESVVVMLDTRFMATVETDPANVSVFEGETATFTVEATGDGVSYQWYYKLAGDDDYQMAESTEDTYSVTATEDWNGAKVYCVVTDAYENTDESKTATLTVKAAVRITQQPTDAWAYENETATVSVTAVGEDLEYEWYYSIDGGATWKLTSANGGRSESYSLKMTKSRDDRLVKCKVTDGYGKSVESDAVLLDTRFKATIETDPANVSVFEGDTATFTVEATGDGVTYQWYYKLAGDDDYQMAECTENALSVMATEAWNGAKVYCVVTDAYENTDESKTATLTVKGAVKITQQPTDAWAYENETATVSVTAIGEDLEYEWYYSIDGGATWKLTSASGGRSATYSLKMTASRDERLVKCKVTDGYGNSVESDTALLDTRFKATIETNPADVWVYEGDTATFTVEATGDGLTYQWYYKLAGDGAYQMAESTEDTYSVTMTDAWDGAKIRCDVTDAYGNTAESEPATLAMKAVLQITQQPTDAWAYENETATVSVTATGDDLEYEWYYSTDGGDTWKLTGASGGRSATYSLKMTASRDERLVKCKVTDGYGNSEESDAALLDTRFKATIETNPADVWVREGDTATFAVEATGDGLTYQWYYKLAGDGAYQMAESTEDTYSVTMTDAWDGAKIRCDVTDAYGNTAESEPATLTMKAVLQIIEQPTDAWAYEGEKATTSLKAVGDDLSYQWYYKNPNGSTFKASSVVKATCSVTMTEDRDGRQMYCIVTDQYGETVQSDTITLTMKQRFAITQEPSDAWAYEGEKATISVKATGEGLSYLWMYYSDGEWRESSGTKASYSLTMTEARNGRQMKCVITDENGDTLETNVVTLETRKKLEITTQPADASAFEGEKATTTIVAEGESLTYQWYYKDPGMSSFKKSSIVKAKCSVTMTEDRDGRQMYCIVTDEYGSTAQSETVTLTMKHTVEITKHPSDVTKAEDETAKFTVKATGDGLTYQWYYSSNGGKTYKEGSSTSASYSFKATAARDGRMVYCAVTDEYGNTENSAEATLTVTTE